MCEIGDVDVGVGCPVSHADVSVRMLRCSGRICVDCAI